MLPVLPFMPMRRRSFIKDARRRPAQGFTLIEVVLAIAVITFATIGLIGLFGAGLRADQQAGADTAFATMTSRMMAQLSSATNSTALQSMASTSYFFDMDGMPVANTQPVYSCAITLTQTNLPTFSAGKITLVQLQFTWPAIAHPPNTNTINATLPLSY